MIAELPVVMQSDPEMAVWGCPVWDPNMLFISVVVGFFGVVFEGLLLDGWNHPPKKIKIKINLAGT